MPHVVVTGASTGIGFATAQQLTKAGFHVLCSVRKQADADRLKEAFGDDITPLIFDVTDRAAVDRAAEEVRTLLAGKTLAGLINNAGVAVFGPLLELDPDEMRRQLEVNLIGVLHATQAFAPLLGVDPDLEGPRGKIINISSVGGKRAAPFLGPYSASKFALEGFSESLRRELMPYGVDVIIVGPGAIKTPIWDKADQVDTTPYHNSDYYPVMQKFQKHMLASGHKGLAPERVGDLIVSILQNERPKARYAIVPNFIQDRLAPALMPVRMVDRIFAKNLGLLPKKQE